MKTKRLDLYQPNHSDLIGWLSFVRPISNRYTPEQAVWHPFGGGQNFIDCINYDMTIDDTDKARVSFALSLEVKNCPPARAN